MASAASFVNALIDFYEILIIVWCLLSWFPRGRGGVIDDVSEVLGGIVRPYLGFFQRIIPSMGGLDFSPVVAILVLGFLQQGIAAILH